MKVRVADYIAEYLEKIGVKSVFMLSGGGMMHLIDALGVREKPGYLCNHHEQASAFGAEAYARTTGKLGVCYATSGPGATNVLTGLVSAFQDSIPVLYLTGQSKLSQTIQGSKLFGLRQFGTFEVDIVSIVRPVTKYAVFLDDPKMIRYHLEKAVALATSGRPGPVLIDVPVDIQGALIDPGSQLGYAERPYDDTPPDDRTIDALLERLRAARRPLILAGHGVRAAGAVDEFRSLVKTLNVPVASTQMAVDVIAHADELFVGRPGMKGDRPGNFAVQTADLIVSLGCSLHVMTTGYECDKFAPGAYKVQVEMDEFIVKRTQVKVDETIRCGVQAFLRRLRERLGGRAPGAKPLVGTTAWHDRCRSWKQELSVRNEPHKHPKGQLNYYDLIFALADQSGKDDIVVADAGTAFYGIGQAFEIKEGQRALICGAGTMGWGLPAAIGAAVAAPDRRIVCVTGDGSLQTNIQELQTVKHNQLNIKLFVVNNDGYISIRNTQIGYFDANFVGSTKDTGVSFPDLGKLAAAYGIPYFAARAPGELAGAVGQALGAKGPVICEIFTASVQEILPAVNSVRRPDGTMEAKPLHDMYPFLDAAKLKKYLDVD